MRHITFYFDVISPYAHLAFEKLPEVLSGLSYSVRYQPVLLGAVLGHHGQLGPAEITPKRAWTYRHVAWLAQEQGVALQMPASHPFNPLALLRLAAASSPTGQSNRYVTERLFHHVWHGGADAADPLRLQDLVQELAPARDPNSDEVKAQLKAATDGAIARGLFGVPSMEVDGKWFWGFDALPMLRDYLRADAWFDGPDWDAATGIPVGVSRTRRPPV
jgi:2-hydroxychromene-2-carboxylate isomerase